MTNAKEPAFVGPQYRNNLRSTLAQPQTIFQVISALSIIAAGFIWPRQTLYLPWYMVMKTLELLAKCSWACILLIFTAPVFILGFFPFIVSILLAFVSICLPPHRRDLSYFSISTVILAATVFISFGVASRTLPRAKFSLTGYDQNYEHDPQSKSADIIYVNATLQNTGKEMFTGSIRIDPKNVNGSICHRPEEPKNTSNLTIAPSQSVKLSFSCSVFKQELKSTDLPTVISFISNGRFANPYADPFSVDIRLKAVVDNIPPPTPTSPQNRISPYPTITPVIYQYDLFALPTPSLTTHTYHSAELAASFPIPEDWYAISHLKYKSIIPYENAQYFQKKGDNLGVVIFSMPKDGNLSDEELLKKINAESFKFPADQWHFNFNQSEGKNHVAQANITSDHNKLFISIINSPDKTYGILTVVYELKSTTAKEAEQKREYLTVYDMIVKDFSIDSAP